MWALQTFILTCVLFWDPKLWLQCSTKVIFKFLVCSWSTGDQSSSDFGGLGSGSDCNALLVEWWKRRVKTRRHRHGGALWPFTFLPQEDRVVLLVTEERSLQEGETCSSLAERLGELEEKESWKSSTPGSVCAQENDLCGPPFDSDKLSLFWGAVHFLWPWFCMSWAGFAPLRHECGKGPPPQLPVLWRRRPETEYHACCWQLRQWQDSHETQIPQSLCQQDRPMQHPLCKHGWEVAAVHVWHVHDLRGHPLAIHVPTVQPGVCGVLADIRPGILGHRPPTWWHGPSGRRW